MNVDELTNDDLSPEDKKLLGPDWDTKSLVYDTGLFTKLTPEEANAISGYTEDELRFLNEALPEIANNRSE